jgi:prepilin-type N-terminal cleavage/methylation domain-containing protein
MKNIKRGFTLIELLVVIAIIGILTALSFFAINNSRLSAWDAKRKSDIANIQAGLEIYHSDCNAYPISSGTPPVPLISSSDADCEAGNTYIPNTFTDPVSPARIYWYSSDGVSYQLCAGLELGGTAGVCAGSTGNSCGQGVACNYSVTSP